MDDKKVESSLILEKKNVIDKVKDGLLADAGLNLKHYIVEEVVRPAILDLISNIVDSALDAVGSTKNILLYKDSSPKSKTRNGGYTSYSRLSDKYESYREYTPAASRRRMTYDLDDRFIFKTRFAADEKLELMADAIERYGKVSVFELYEFCGETVDFTARDWGWTEVVSARIKQIPGGRWEIVLPRPICLR